MLALAQTIAADPQMAEALGSPKLDADAKGSLFLSVAGDRFSAEMRNFVRILLDGDRVGVLAEIRALYEQRKDEADALGALSTAMGKQRNLEEKRNLKTMDGRPIGILPSDAMRVKDVEAAWKLAAEWESKVGHKALIEDAAAEAALKAMPPLSPTSPPKPKRPI
jgi:hypothetical protein